MDYRTGIFYLALLFIVGCVAELIVRSKGMGESQEKVRGVVVQKKSRLGPPILLLVASIVVAALTIPR